MINSDIKQCKHNQPNRLSGETVSRKTLLENLFPKGARAGIAICTIFMSATILSLFCRIPVKKIMSNYSYDVIIILMIMELFTNLIARTGIMEFLATKLAVKSKGHKRIIAALFGILMFLISSTLNNITAVMMILPIIFVLLKAIDVDRHYINVLFSIILALSNTGGAASPIGDFPAIVIMTSGITTFLGYVSHAFPLFAVTSIIIIFFWTRFIKEEPDGEHARELAVSFLQSQYKYVKVRWDLLGPICLIFASMFLAWSLIDQNTIPPEIIAILGYVCAAAFCALKRVPVLQDINLKSVLLIASFLYFATVISQTGILANLAYTLQGHIQNPMLLLIIIMLMTSICSGIFSAGPAAAAIMPIIVQLCNGPFASQTTWVAIAYAASICAGSSFFMWSATAGFILSEKVNEANICSSNGTHLIWNILSYLRFGLINYLLQMSIAIIWILVVCSV
ncbi:SLC13 family permease [Fusibacter sp. 3D3]|uniref:SLC13 family permease n=1 Tax=Fusibacter sp. 3D3 TaxID=1048380 RepID=UPI00085365D3|nr:SLC13 family permease [Fusibacter sp. 3D3]GAU75616.1 probable membrane transport protein [Fusibacter sp. 3D3]